jgi:CRP-like cAMP-binding protein
MNSNDNQTPTGLFAPGLLVLLFLGQGCTSISDKFTGSEREEIKPFAQKTVDVLVVEDIQIRDNELLHLRPYVDDTFVELDELQRHMNQVKQYRNKLVEYSIDLVRLTEQYDKEPARIAAYASHLEEIIGETERERIGLSEGEWGEILVEIRNQKTFLNALRSFQPVIAVASDTFAALVTRIESELLVATRKEFDRRIESSFQEVNQLLSILRKKRRELLGAMLALEGYRGGNDGAIGSFRQTGTHLDEVFTSDRPNEDQLAALEADLRERISYSTLLIAEMDNDYANYVKTRAELDQKELEILEALTIARLQIETWTQAHHALARGVKQPGELMQLTVRAARDYLIP